MKANSAGEAEDRYLTVQEFARRIRRAPGTVYNWISANECPVKIIQIKGRLLIPESEVCRLFKENTRRLGCVPPCGS